MVLLITLAVILGYNIIAAIVARCVFLYWQAIGEPVPGHEVDAAVWLGLAWPFCLVYHLGVGIVHAVLPIGDVLHRRQWFLTPSAKAKIRDHRALQRDLHIATMEDAPEILPSTSVRIPTHVPPMEPIICKSSNPLINLLLHQAATELPENFNIDSVEVTDTATCKLVFHAHGDGKFHESCPHCRKLS